MPRGENTRKGAQGFQKTDPNDLPGKKGVGPAAPSGSTGAGNVAAVDYDTAIAAYTAQKTANYDPAYLQAVADYRTYSVIVAVLADRNPSSGEPKQPPSITVGSPEHALALRAPFGDTTPANEDKAARIAEVAHTGQTDQTGEAYILHPAGVVQQMTQLPEYANLTPTQQETARKAAWLHDTLEDTAFTETDLRNAGFDDDVIDTINAVTSRKNEPKLDYYERIKAAGPVAVTVKLGDLTHNNLPERRANLPGSPTRPVQPGEEDRYTKLGKKYWIAYTALGSTVPAHLTQFAPD